MILVGNISKDLYWTLLPLLSGHGELFANGQWIKIPGKLYLIIDNAHVEKLALFDVTLEKIGFVQSFKKLQHPFSAVTWRLFFELLNKVVAMQVAPVNNPTQTSDEFPMPAKNDVG